MAKLPVRTDTSIPMTQVRFDPDGRYKIRINRPVFVGSWQLSPVMDDIVVPGRIAQGIADAIVAFERVGTVKEGAV